MVSRMGLPATAGKLLTFIMILASAYDSTGAALVRNESQLFGFGSSCSTTCDSSGCSFAPTLRYGKYCGLGHTGCTGELPCDGLDACCQAHDDCIGNNFCNYLNVTCNSKLIECATRFKSSGAPQFYGATCSTSELVSVIDSALKIGVQIGRLLNISGSC